MVKLEEGRKTLSKLIDVRRTATFGPIGTYYGESPKIYFMLVE